MANIWAKNEVKNTLFKMCTQIPGTCPSTIINQTLFFFFNSTRGPALLQPIQVMIGLFKNEKMKRLL